MSQQQESRRAAAKAFIESLEQLQQSLEAVDNQPASAQAASNGSIGSTSMTEAQFSLNAWEDAIADIDQYIQQQNNL